MVWTIWGYHLPIDDSYGVLDNWQKRLAVYPSKLKLAILRRHVSSLRYWSGDYHYRENAARGDTVFLAGLTSRLVHDMAQILFALNEVYFPGDGNNLPLLARQRILPRDFGRRIEEILYPAESTRALDGQRERLIAPAHEVLELVEEHNSFH